MEGVWSEGLEVKIGDGKVWVRVGCSCVFDRGGKKKEGFLVFVIVGMMILLPVLRGMVGFEKGSGWGVDCSSVVKSRTAGGCGVSCFERIYRYTY